VYQRTPIWVSPKLDFPVPKAVRRAFAAVPFTQRVARLTGTALLELMMVSGVLHYKQLPAANRLGKLWCQAHLRRQVRDPGLRAELTPRYSFGCKRPTFSNEYYPAFTRDHVHLETTSIAKIDESGIETADGRRRDIDVLVLATGFDLWEANFPAVEIIGRDGRDLGKWWRENRFQAYEGVAIPKFPNFISLNSPYSYSGLSYFTTIETQMRHMDRLFGAMRRRGATEFEVTQEANDAFLDRMTERLGDSIFTLGNCGPANSYYFNPHGEATLLRPSSTLNAIKEAQSFPVEDYTFA